MMEYASDFTGVNDANVDAARKGLQFRALLEPLQASFTAIEKCDKPVIAVIHGACIGGGIYIH